MKFNLTRKPEYSRGKWRLTDEFGEDIYMPQSVESSNGTYCVNMPVCKDTQSALIQHILELFAKALAKIEQLNAEKTGFYEMIERGGFDISPCRNCGESLVCVPEGLALCKTCATKGGDA